MTFKLSFLVPVVMLSGCLSQGSTRVHSYWGTTIERPPSGTIYDWAAQSDHLDPGQDPNIRKAIQDDVEYEMDAMHFVKRADAQSPAVLISVHWGRGLQPSPSGPEQRATLAVRIHDASTSRLIYCASADALVDPMLTPEDRRARIDHAIHELLKPLDPYTEHRNGRHCNGQEP